MFDSYRSFSPDLKRCSMFALAQVAIAKEDRKCASDRPAP